VTGQLLGKFFRKVPDNLVDMDEQKRQPFDDGSFDVATKLCERYCRGELVVHIHVALESEQYRKQFCWSIVHVDSPVLEVQPYRPDDQDKFMVFVDNAQVMQNPERIVGCFDSKLIRLQSIDGCRCAGANSLYFSTETLRYEFLRRLDLEDRELVSSGRLLAVGEHQLPDEMVESRPQLVDDFSSQDGEFNWNAAGRMILKRISKSLQVGVGDGSVFARIKEGVGFQIQIEDVLFGPLELFSNSI